MSDPRWLTREIVLVLHGELLAEHGGLSGLRGDGATLDAALARPRQKHHYESWKIPALAAALSFGLCTGHPFLDGNKRVALAALDVFLRLNGWHLEASEAGAVTAVRALAAGERSEVEWVAWVEEHARRL